MGYMYLTIETTSIVIPQKYKTKTKLVMPIIFAAWSNLILVNPSKVRLAYMPRMINLTLWSAAFLAPVIILAPNAQNATALADAAASLLTDLIDHFFTASWAAYFFASS